MGIRAGETADIPALMALRESVAENRLSDPLSVGAEQYRSFIARGDLFVWDEGGPILGFSAGDRDNGWIWALFVRPDCEGRGIGQALLAAACDTLRRAGFGEFTLSTDPGTRAAQFYRRAGWREAGQAPDGEAIFKRPAQAAPDVAAPPRGRAEPGEG